MNTQSDLQSPLVGEEDTNGNNDRSSNITKNLSLNNVDVRSSNEHVKDEEEDEKLDNSDDSESTEEEITQVREASFVEDHSSWRKININNPEPADTEQSRFVGNQIHTAKYTWWSFLPKNLFFQFTKMANVYFLIMMIFQMIPQISISDGRPTIGMPLGFVVLVCMVKDIIEDSKRHSSDNRENNSEVLCIPFPEQMRYINQEEKGIFKTLRWSKIKVGQIVKVLKDQYFPADLILLNSNDPQGICFVETKNLDGETNLKSKIPHKNTIPCTMNDEDVAQFTGQINCQGPNEFLYRFEGNMTFIPSKEEFLANESTYEGGKTTISLDVNQTLLRGSSLRNTDYAYGIVIYTGHESKIMKNSPSSRNKLSKMEKKTNWLIISLFGLELFLILFASIYSTIWNHTNADETEQYLRWAVSVSILEDNIAVSFLVNLGSWLLIFAAFIPISLLVTLEIVKFFQALLITWDHTLYDEEKDMAAKVQSSNLNEELGQIEYIFSDKTGTLTQNVMEFKKM